MTDLNYRADHLHETPKRLQRNFSSEIVCIKVRKKKFRNSQNWFKIFGEQYILAEMYTMLIEGYTDYKVETKTGLGEQKYVLMR